jgi:hypothetical protein
MRTMGVLPIDPQLQKMNFHQWMWCYYNVVEDEKEEQEVFKAHLDRLAFIVNPEIAKSVFEHEKKLRKKRESGKNKKREVEFEKEDPFKNDDFDVETRAALLGYDPSMNISPQEFLNQYKEKQKLDEILNGDIDDLIEENVDLEIDDSGPVGDPDEDPDDFLTRALSFRDNFPDEVILNPDGDLSSIDDLEQDPELMEKLLDKERARKERLSQEDYEMDVFDIEGDDE